MNLIATVLLCTAFQTDCPWIRLAPVKVTCEDPSGWTLSVEPLETGRGPGTAGLVVRGRTDAARPAPPLTVAWNIPQDDAPFRWLVSGNSQAPDWTRQKNDFLLWMPLDCIYSRAGTNRLTWGTRETRRPTVISCRVHEETCTLDGKLEFNVNEPAARTNAFDFEICLDARAVPYYEAVSGMAAWMREDPHLRPPRVPEAAFEPLYSTWYSFHQDLSAAAVEAECALAAKLGMKTLIVDDGWQMPDVRRDYGSCGDWAVATNKFPDFRAHVAKVHALGLKYMPWIALGMTGNRSKAFYDLAPYTYVWTAGRPEVVAPDPRFPQVRTYLADICERFVREADVDGFKLDFVDYFGRGPLAKPGDGRDIVDELDAVEELLREIRARVDAIKPDILIEYRVAYFGAAVGQYGNIFRVSDCPGNAAANRTGGARLRLIAGPTAVHSDMLEWRADVTPADAARHVLNAMFNVIQYSVRLTEMPPDHLRMIAHWLKFSLEHRDTLLKGRFMPLQPEFNYPVIGAESGRERIWGVYSPSVVCRPGALDRPVYILNGTGEDTVLLDFETAFVVAVAYDCFGVEQARPACGKGLQRVNVPAGGYLKLCSDERK